MKKAVALIGCLRTFLMPNKNNIKLIDAFIDTFNEYDVFISAADFDLYQNGKIHKEKINHDLITKELSIIKNIKHLTICADYNDELVLRKNSFAQQLIRKNNIKKEIETYESKNNFLYDIIVKWRFDNEINKINNDFLNFNYVSQIIYTPGVHGHIIYDWFAHGNNSTMKSYLSLYDFVKNNIENCHSCTKCSYYGKIKPHGCIGEEYFELTYALEYYIYKMSLVNNIKLQTSTIQSSPIRYQSLT